MKRYMFVVLGLLLLTNLLISQTPDFIDQQGYLYDANIN